MLTTTFIVAVALALHTPCVSAQTIDDLRKRIEQLEQSTRDQVELLKRQIDRQEAERGQERRAAEERERTIQTLQEQVAQQQLRLSTKEERVAGRPSSWTQLVDLNTGAKQTIPRRSWERKSRAMSTRGRTSRSTWAARCA